jgi:hypothetical protein
MMNGHVDFHLEEVRPYRMSISSYQLQLAALGAPVESYALWHMALHRGMACTAPSSVCKAQCLQALFVA